MYLGDHVRPTRGLVSVNDAVGVTDFAAGMQCVCWPWATSWSIQ